MGAQIRAINCSPEVRRRIEFFSSQFEFVRCRGRAVRIQDQGHSAPSAGVEWRMLTAQETGKDRLKDLGAQSKNGISVRTLMTLLHYAKAMAFFRGNARWS